MKTNHKTRYDGVKLIAITGLALKMALFGAGVAVAKPKPKSKSQSQVSSQSRDARREDSKEYDEAVYEDLYQTLLHAECPKSNWTEQMVKRSSDYMAQVIASLAQKKEIDPQVFGSV